MRLNSSLRTPNDLDAEPNSHLELKLNVIRELDSLVDFCRGTIQLKIILALAENASGLTIKELAIKIMSRYKAVADALRKLEKKNLVRKANKSGVEYYELTEKGWEYYEKLTAVLGLHKVSKRLTKSSKRVLLKDLVENLTLYGYVADAIIALATAKNYELPLSKISSLFKLSPSRTQSYLNVFADPQAPVRLFRKIQKPSLTRRVYEFLGINKGPYKVYYKLTKDGLSVYYKLPHYIKFGNSIAAKIIKRLVGTTHPKIALKTILLILTFGNIAASLGILIEPKVALIIPVWILSQIFILLLVHVAY